MVPRENNTGKIKVICNNTDYHNSNEIPTPRPIPDSRLFRPIPQWISLHWRHKALLPSFDSAHHTPQTPCVASLSSSLALFLNRNGNVGIYIREIPDGISFDCTPETMLSPVIHMRTRIKINLNTHMEWWGVEDSKRQTYIPPNHPQAQRIPRIDLGKRLDTSWNRINFEAAMILSPVHAPGRQGSPGGWYDTVLFPKPIWIFGGALSSSSTWEFKGLKHIICGDKLMMFRWEWMTINTA